jgi:hypothetical protein
MSCEIIQLSAVRLPAKRPAEIEATAGAIVASVRRMPTGASDRFQSRSPKPAETSAYG